MSSSKVDTVHLPRSVGKKWIAVLQMTGNGKLMRRSSTEKHGSSGKKLSHGRETLTHVHYCFRVKRNLRIWPCISQSGSCSLFSPRVTRHRNVDRGCSGCSVCVEIMIYPDHFPPKDPTPSGILSEGREIQKKEKNGVRRDRDQGFFSHFLYRGPM
jgi:hypothetical protein